MSKAIISRYVNRCTTNREHRLTLKICGFIKYQDIVVISANCQKSGFEDELEGFVKSIKKYVHRESLLIKDNFKDHVDQLRNEFKDEIKTLKRDMKHVIKSQMDS